MAEALTQFTIGDTHFNIKDWTAQNKLATLDRNSVSATLNSVVQGTGNDRIFWNAKDVHAYELRNRSGDKILIFDANLSTRLALTAHTRYDNAYVLKINNSALSGYAGGIGTAGNVGLVDVHADGTINFRPSIACAAGVEDIPIRGIIY